MSHRAKLLTVLSAFPLFLVLNVLPAAADGSFSGKTLALFAGSGPTPANMSATILKGKKKNVLVIDVKVTLANTSGAEVSVFQPTVNSLGTVEPIALAGVTTTKCAPGGTGCSVSGTYWFDIDAAELIIPGAFYNQPLNVAINIATSPAGATSTSMVVKMEKK